MFSFSTTQTKLRKKIRKRRFVVWWFDPMSLLFAKLLENSKLALKYCSDEWRSWVSNKVKVAHQPLHSSIRVKWEFSSNCGI